MREDIGEKRLIRLIESATAISALASGMTDSELEHRIRELFQATYRVCSRYSTMVGCSLSDLGLQQKLAEFDKVQHSSAEFDRTVGTAATRG